MKFTGRILYLMFPAGLAMAHHSFAMFDMSRTVTLHGTVKQFQWTNPHCFIQLEVPSAEGSVEWSLEMNSPGASLREGWKHGSLQPGDQVTIIINPLRDGARGGRVVLATDANGRALHKITGRAANSPVQP